MVELNKNVYKKLARKLDAIPNGFPETERGVELKILAKIYTPEEATLASKMRLTSEIAEQIALRAGWNPAKATIVLEDMVRKGLIDAIGEGEQRKFCLMPFVVGVYEEQLGRLDEGMARLFEEYYQALGESLFSHSPSVHKVIPVEKSIPVEVQVFPYEQASALMDKAKSFAVGECICRVQKGLVGEPCKYPVEVCLWFASVEGAFDDHPNARVLTKEEAIQVLRESEEAGLIHSSANVREGHSYICNCCTCCCGMLRGISQLGIENSVAKSDFYATVDSEMCTGCETCVERCQFGAPSLVDNVSRVDLKRCVGCGLCVVTCSSGSMTLVRKSEGQFSPTPRDMEEWMMERAESRGISLEEIL
jgi:Na+-translocating ferredoxin:NAD+ oxidoreductase RNF subunit RnfB